MRYRSHNRSKTYKKGVPYGRGINQAYLDSRKERLVAGGWPISKWITFCEEMLQAGYVVNVYESQTTRSKYVYVSREKKTFKVRFSNHRPAREKQGEGDSDFYVGVSHGVVTTTADAKKAVETFFCTARLDERPHPQTQSPIHP